MASPRRAASPNSFDRIRSTGARALAVATPSTAVGVTSPEEEIIWKRLREAGFDEETVKMRDKAALISYVTRLEAEIYDYQCNMGLVLLEKKDLESKYREIKVSSESAEIIYKRDKAADLSALAEARKREERLKKALGIEKECLANIEKALHEMRVESAEIKVAYESKLSEAQSKIETSQNMFDEAKSKIHEADASQAEAIRCQNTALRNLHDVEAREDTLRRRIASFHSECDAKEAELSLQRQCLNDSQKILHQEQERLMDGQNLLSQREEYLHGRLKELDLAEKELMEARRKFDEDSLILKEEKANLELIVSALATREEVVIEREALLDKRDRELLILQEKISNKEFDEIQRLKAEYQSSFERKTYEFEAKMEKRRKSLEDEIETKTQLFSDRVVELRKREKRIVEMENSVQSELHSISEKQDDTLKKLQLLEEKEKSLLHTEKMIESKMQDLKTEKEEISKMKEEHHKDKVSLQNEKTKILYAEEKLARTENERNEILVLERKLKEEIDSFRIQMLELEAEADKLKSEKEKFETEWDLIDEKREELRKEADLISKEREAVRIYLKNELDNLNIEKETLRNQLKQNADSLSLERDEFMRKMESEHSDWFIKFHKEKDDFMKDVMVQRIELENSISRRREEVESYLREKEVVFEQGKIKELQNITSQKEEISRQLKHVSSELKRLENERFEIAHDREQRQKEWSEIKSFIEELNIQREKLQKQRELLHVDREEIDKQIQHLMKLENLQIELESRTLYEPSAINPEVNNGTPFSSKELYHPAELKYVDAIDCQKTSLADDMKAKFSSKNDSNNTLPPSAPMTWFRKCAEVIFKRSPVTITDATFQEDCESRLSADLKHYHENTEDVQTLEFRRNREEKVCHPLEDKLIAVTEDKCKSNERSQYLLPLRRKRLSHAVSNDHSGSKPEHNLVKKLRQNGLAEMEAVLDCPGRRDFPGDHATAGIILEAVGSTAVIRLADDGCELKEHEDFDEKGVEHPSVGAKIKKFLVT
ncbi:putative nuclear matrix constituent protein 1-like protein [Platanthera zijinensis]|uniref:Nuclear matrix constituent protein 1-like protein n=1 Tax=Platanthera zijinensis TaxID=2320716 RepID=A0AAP0BJA2_9ASPA